MFLREGGLMQKSNLKSLIHKHYMTASLTPLLIIGAVLIIVYFVINSYFSSKVSATFRSEAAGYADQLISKEAALIGSRLDDIAQYAQMLQKEHESLFNNPGYELRGKEPVFRVHSNGVFFKASDNGGSSLYYSSDTVIGEPELKKALFTESMDASFKNLVENNSLVSQVYINTWDRMNRLYPYIPNVPEAFGPVITPEEFDFYVLADSQNNPARKPVWTTAYLDPAGLGWLVSCIVPVYSGDFLEGVTGIDITVRNIVKNILNIKLDSGSDNHFSTFMTDSSGVILAMNEKVEELFGLKELKNHVYSEKISSMTVKPEEFSLLKHPDSEVRTQLGSMFSDSFQNAGISLYGKNYFVVRKTIPQTGWHLFVLTDTEQLLAPISGLEKLSMQIGAGGVVLMSGFIIFLYFFFRKSAGQLALRVSEPVSKLNECTKHVGTGFFCVDYEDCGIEEIDRLNRNFDTMNRQLEKRTQELVRSEVEKLEKEQEAERLLIISITDPLTGIYNRLKLDEILDYELEQSGRYGKDLSVIIADLDHFKTVNDRCGHQAGDMVLVEVGKILKENTRSSDTVARWGGEEFIAVCTNTGLDEACGLAEKLRKVIDGHSFGVDTPVTASFGVAQLKAGEAKESFIGRADEALYEAKKKSRNIVVKAG